MMNRPLGILVWVGCAACSSADLGVDYQGEKMPVVDMHLHPGDWDEIPEGTQGFLARRFPFPLGMQPKFTTKGVLTGPGIRSELDDAGVSEAVLFAVYAPRTVGVATNERVIAELDDDDGRFWGLASLRVDNWATDKDKELKRLDDALAHPEMVGVKLAHAHMHFRMDDPAYFGIYEVAAKHDAPVYLHTGTSPFPNTSQDAPYTDPAYLEPAIVAHPDTKFILGHLGHDFVSGEEGALQTCIRLAQDYPNVFLEPSALGSEGSDPKGSQLRLAMRLMREGQVVDKIIYGSDGPQGPGFVGTYLERTMEAMVEAGYTKDEARLVLGGNFARVFGTPEPKL